MSTLFVNNLNTASGSTITIPTGKQLVGTDAASIYAPGMVVQMAERAGDNNVSRAASTSTSYVATNLQVTITPKFNNSKIIVRCVTTANTNQSTGSGELINYTLYRSIDGGSFSAVRAQTNGIGHVYGANARTQTSITAEVVDTPNTTDEVRYKIYMKSVNGTSVEIPGTTTEAATFTATEIKV